MDLSLGNWLRRCGTCCHVALFQFSATTGSNEHV